MLQLKCEEAFNLCIYLSCKSSLAPPAGPNYFMGEVEGGGLIERSVHLRSGAYSILLLFQTTRKWY